MRRQVSCAHPEYSGLSCRRCSHRPRALAFHALFFPDNSGAGLWDAHEVIEGLSDDFFGLQLFREQRLTLVERAVEIGFRFAALLLDLGAEARQPLRISSYAFQTGDACLRDA